MFGRVRALNNDKGERVENAGPAVPVEVIGFSGVPGAGERFVVLDEERKARAVIAVALAVDRGERQGQRLTLLFSCAAPWGRCSILSPVLFGPGLTFAVVL
jgi:translation initiation factor IF-2